MSCFWDSLINIINISDFKHYLKYNNNNKPTPQLFANLLNQHNLKTSNIIWNNIDLTEKQLDENYEAVNCYDTSTVNNGYYCSTFEPFLFLVSELFEVSIQHNFNGSNQFYENKKKTRHIFHFGSNTGHFYIK